MIQFAAQPHHKVGTVIRYYGKRAKFWRIVQIKAGRATAKPCPREANDYRY